MLMTDAPSTDEIELSVVVPVKNEAENIRILIDEIDAALEPCGVRYEILYVDDGSDDATLGELVAVGTSNERLRVIRHRTSAGQSTAVLTGVRHARGIWIATLDGDGQNDPADIPKLLEKLGDPLLLLAGWRAHRKDTAYYRFQSRIANRVRSALLGDATPDTGCGLKLFNAATFLRLPHFDHFHRFLPALFIRAGGSVESVVVNHRPRLRGASKYGLMNRLWVGIVDIFGVMWLKSRPVQPDILPGPTDNT